MDFGLSPEQEQLKNAAREFLAARCPPAAVRKAMESRDGTAPELYSEIAKLEWNGLIIPEEFGGVGLGMLDMAVLMEEQGYAAMPGPFVFSAALAAGALSEFGTDELRRRWLPAIAAGKATGTIALGGQDRDMGVAASAAHNASRGGEIVLSGRMRFVPYAHAADFIILGARFSQRPADNTLIAVETRSAGVKIRAMNHLDLTRRVAEAEFHDVRVGPEARCEGGASALARMLDIGAIAIASDSLGGAARALDMAVEYSKVREQFGRPIGSFQALKHLAAEMAAEIEPARSLLWYAAYAQDARADDASRAASMAKARLSEIYSRVTDRTVLMHGGIGFTWDHDLHLWFKRARFNDSCFGSPLYHRERVAHLGGY